MEFEAKPLEYDPNYTSNTPEEEIAIGLHVKILKDKMDKEVMGLLGLNP